MIMNYKGLIRKYKISKITDQKLTKDEFGLVNFLISTFENCIKIDNTYYKDDDKIFVYDSLYGIANCVIISNNIYDKIIDVVILYTILGNDTIDDYFKTVEILISDFLEFIFNIKIDGVFAIKFSD